MTKHEFLANLEDVLEADAGTIKSDNALMDLAGWDSLAIMAFIAMVDEKFGTILSPKKITAAETVQDLITLLGDKIT